MAQDRIYLTCKGCGGSYMLAAVRANNELDVPDVDGPRFTNWLREHLGQHHPVAREWPFPDGVCWINFGGDPGLALNTESRPPALGEP